MFTDIISNINWIDVLIVLCVCRVIYIGTKSGFVVELLKFIGLLFAVFVTFHYYSDLAKFLHNSITLSSVYLEILCFGFLLSVILFLFKLIREGMMIILKVQAHPILDKWGGLVISVLRGFFVASLILVFSQILQIQYIDKTIKQSFFSDYLHDIAPNFYRTCYSSFIEKLFQSEKLNPSVFKLNNNSTSKPSR